VIRMVFPLSLFMVFVFGWGVSGTDQAAISFPEGSGADRHNVPYEEPSHNPVGFAYFSLARVPGPM